MNMPAEHGHLLGDIPALLLVAVVLAVLMPRGASAEVLTILRPARNGHLAVTPVVSRERRTLACSLSAEV
jgi:hypothetical protein